MRKSTFIPTALATATARLSDDFQVQVFDLNPLDGIAAHSAGPMCAGRG